MTVALIVFFASLALTIALFGLKLWEEQHETRLAPSMRDKADALAHALKAEMDRGRVELEKLPPQVGHLIMRGIITLAHSVASGARRVEYNAHRLAEVVSTRRGFQRRETKSDFLKKVTDFKSDREVVEE